MLLCFLGFLKSLSLLLVTNCLKIVQVFCHFFRNIDKLTLPNSSRTDIGLSRFRRKMTKVDCLINYHMRLSHTPLKVTCNLALIINLTFHQAYAAESSAAWNYTHTLSPMAAQLRANVPSN